MQEFVLVCKKYTTQVKSFKYYVKESTIVFICSDGKEIYALKQIEGTGISMSACREIAVSIYCNYSNTPDG